MFPSGGTGPYTYSAVTPLPPGCAIETGSQLLSNFGTNVSYGMVCTPFAAGTYTFTVQITDSLGNIGVTTSVMKVLPFNMFSLGALPNGSVGAPYSQTLLVWDNSTTVSFAVAAGNALPAGLSISANTITGTPTAAGSYSFTLVATDSNNVPINFGFSLVISTIQITNPEIIPTQVIADVPYTYTFTATGGGSTKTWSATSLPSGITMNPTTGVISGTTSRTGTIRITVTVTDGTSTYTHAFTLFARFSDPAEPSLNIAATLLSDTRVGQSVTFALSPLGGISPYTWAVATGSSLPPGLQLHTGTSLSVYSSNQTAGLTYLEGAVSTAGQYSFDLIATDSTGATFRRTFTLNVTPITILSVNLRTPIIGIPYAQQLTAVGGTGPYTFTFTPVPGIDMLPPGFTASSSGLISGTTTSTGVFEFYVTANDSAGHSYQTIYAYAVVNLSGLYVNSLAPSGVAQGSFISQTLVAGGTSTYSWSVSAGSLPPGLSLVPSGTNTLLQGYPSQAGTFSYTLRATDNNNSANFADRAFTAVIQPMQVITHRVNQLPPATVGVDYTYTVQVAGGTGPYTFLTSQLLSPLPPGLTLSASGVLSGTPTQTGSFSFSYQITDSNNQVGYGSIPTLVVLAPGANNPLLGNSFGFHAGAIGVPYLLELDQTVSGGVAPFTWSVATGSSLPPGLAIVPGSNGISAYLAGIPTTAGTYSYSLTATDSVGQAATVFVATHLISTISVPAPSSALGMVGSPLSLTFAPTGGTAPYSFTLIGPGLPPGLSLSSSGVLSGTPTAAGEFAVGVSVTDSASLTTNVAQVIVTIDDATHEAPGIGISPAAIQMSYIVGAPQPAPAQAVVNATTGTLPFTAMVSGIPGVTLSASSGTGPTTLNLNLDTTQVTAGTYAGVVALNSPQSAGGYTGVPVVLTVLAPPPCDYTLNPASGSGVAGGGAGAFTVNTGSLCAVTASTTDSFITITGSPANGSGTVSYNLTANTGTTARTGNITVNGVNFAITQFGSACSLAISPNSINVTAAGGQASVNVTASNGACTWSASGLGAAPVSGTGNGTVTLTIPSSSSSSSQALTATVAGQTFTVNQGGVNCVTSLSASSASAASGGGAGSVNVTTPAACTYDTVTGPSWITIASGGSGSGPGPVALNYTVAPNSTTIGRNGTLMIGGQPFTISQDPTPCSVTVDATGLGSPFGPSGGSGPIAITANGGNCSWTAASDSTWATVVPASGSGNGTLNVTVGSNAASTTSRLATLTIAGQSVGVQEAGTSCTYGLGSATASVPPAGGSGSVRVTAPGVCSWTATTDSTASWLTISSSGTAGTSDVSFVAAVNTLAAPRSGTLTIAGQPYLVTQGAAPCTYTLSASNTTLAAAGGSSSFTFSTGASGCSASAVSYSNWLTVGTSSSTDGTSGTVNYTAAAISSGATRSGTIQFAGQTFTVNQTGAACAYSLNSYGLLVNAGGGSGTVIGTPSAQLCTPAVATDQPTFVLLGTLAGPTQDEFFLPFTVGQFNSFSTVIRRATITFGGQIHVIKQTSW